MEMRWAIKTQSDYRVSAKTHPIVIIELVGYQWALSEATLDDEYIIEGFP